MESHCVAKYLHVTPRKMRLVADLVRGKSVNDAIGLLKFTHRSAALPTLKAIQSAVANIVNSDEARNVNPDELVVTRIFVDEGPAYRRFLPRAMGRATLIRKRMSHLTVHIGLPQIEDVEEAEESPVEETASPEKPAAPVKKARAKKAPAPKSSAKRTAKTRSKKTE
ncbi:50S ribosomal protein L22 [bacterium]|nr:50S ribosomal protein L22 [bacterium]MBU1984438.1 50S ribosomal protein L22 [bacterium]